MKSRVSEKGQVTIPKSLRRKLGLRAGQVLEFEARGGALIGRKASEADPVARVYGILKPRDVDSEIEGMRGGRWDAAVHEPRAHRR